MKLFGQSARLSLILIDIISRHLNTEEPLPSGFMESGKMYRVIPDTDQYQGNLTAWYVIDSDSNKIVTTLQIVE